MRVFITASLSSLTFLLALAIAPINAHAACANKKCSVVKNNSAYLGPQTRTVIHCAECEDAVEGVLEYTDCKNKLDNATAGYIAEPGKGWNVSLYGGLIDGRVVCMKYSCDICKRASAQLFTFQAQKKCRQSVCEAPE